VQTLALTLAELAS